MKTIRQGRSVTGLLMLLVLAGCDSRSAGPPPPSLDEVRAKIVHLMLATVYDRQGWASDIYTAFSAQQIYSSDENPCAVPAVIEQESTYQVDPPVAGLDRITTRGVERRVGKLYVSAFLISLALDVRSPGGRTYSQRLAVARTKKGLNETLDDFIAIIPMGGKLFDGFNPIHIGGPMQVSIAFAEQYADGCPYPLDDSIHHEVFSRRGGMYFDVAHLFGYLADYPAPLYRFAGFNAGWHASRSVAFQDAVSRVSGIPLVLDGDLIRCGTHTPSSTKLAVRNLGKRLNMSDAAIRWALGQGDSPELANSAPYRKVFALTGNATGKALPRAVLSGIALEGPKIIRKLTTTWSAKHVDEHYQRCMAHVRKRWVHRRTGRTWHRHGSLPPYQPSSWRSSV